MFRHLRSSLAASILLLFSVNGHSQTATPPTEFYKEVRAFKLRSAPVHLDHFQVKHDRVEMEFNGDFFLEEPVAGHTYGAVFFGQGTVKNVPGNDFEKESVQRFLKTDTIQTDFYRAVLRFTDGTLDPLPFGARDSAAGQSEQARRMANELDARMLRQIGLNLSARLVAAVFNHDQPGVFFAEFEGSKAGTFDLLIDHQTRAIGPIFGINGGEKVVFFKDRGELYGTDVWTASYDDSDFLQNQARYSDAFDLVSVSKYTMQIDLRDVPHRVVNDIEIDLAAKQEGVQVLPFSMNEGLGDYWKERLKKAVHVKEASLADGTPIEVVQEPWETGFTLFLPRPLVQGADVKVRIKCESENSFMDWQGAFHYPLSTTTWYPRHAYLGRSVFDLTFLHKKNSKVISSGSRLLEETLPDGSRRTRWATEDAVGFISFAVGPFEVHTAEVSVGGRKVPIEFYSAPGGYAAIKEDFIVAELQNSVNFFSQMFGEFPFQRLGAAFFPAGFGQGFPTMLLLPSSGRSSIWDFAFIAHETSHQWWGNEVAWRSYRDQWLSEGFAEYSGALYSASRDNPKRAMELVRDMRRVLDFPARTDTGISNKKLWQVGPLIMGGRLSSRLTGGGYYVLTYYKGGLVLRMLHFLFTNPANLDDRPFYAMMKDFVQRYHFRSASTEDFFAVASEHFARTPVAQKYGLRNLDWFLRQWVYTAEMPKYKLRYQFAPRAEGGVWMTGTIEQQGVPADWIMPLPLALDFGVQSAHGTILAHGSSAEIKVPLPAEPKKVRLDPDLWVLSDGTDEEKGK